MHSCVSSTSWKACSSLVYIVLPNDAMISFISFRVRVAGGVYPLLVYAVTTMCFDSGLMGVVYPDVFIIRSCNHLVSYPYILWSKIRMISVVTDLVCRSATFSLVFTYSTTISPLRTSSCIQNYGRYMYWFPVDMKCALVSLFAAWLSPYIRVGSRTRCEHPTSCSRLRIHMACEAA